MCLVRYRQFCAALFISAAFIGAIPGCGLPWDKWDCVFLQSPGPPEKTPGDLGLNYEDVRIPTPSGNQMAGWFVPAASGNPKATFLVHTGMRGNIETYLSIIPWAADNNYNLLIYDWEGFGASEGEPDFDNFEPDIHAAVDYLLSRPESSTGIIQMGASFGAVPSMAATVAYPDQTIGLVLYGAGFTEELATTWLEYRVNPLLAMVGRWGDGVWNILLPDFFQANRYFGQIKVPVLQVIASDDSIIVPQEQEHFYKSLPQPKQLYMTYGDHVHAPDTDPNLGPAVIEWANQLPAIVARQQ